MTGNELIISDRNVTLKSWEDVDQFGCRVHKNERYLLKERKRKITAAKIHNTLRSFLNSDFVPDIYTLYLIYLRLLIEPYCHLPLISSGKDSSLMYITLYPFLKFVFTIQTTELLTNNLRRVLH